MTQPASQRSLQRKHPGTSTRPTQVFYVFVLMVRGSRYHYLGHRRDHSGEEIYREIVESYEHRMAVRFMGLLQKILNQSFSTDDSVWQEEFLTLAQDVEKQISQMERVCQNPFSWRSNFGSSLASPNRDSGQQSHSCEGDNRIFAMHHLGTPFKVSCHVLEAFPLEAGASQFQLVFQQLEVQPPKKKETHICPRIFQVCLGAHARSAGVTHRVQPRDEPWDPAQPNELDECT